MCLLCFCVDRLNQAALNSPTWSPVQNSDVFGTTIMLMNGQNHFLSHETNQPMAASVYARGESIAMAYPAGFDQGTPLFRVRNLRICKLVINNQLSDCRMNMINVCMKSLA